jgi:hypothetical protein
MISSRSGHCVAREHAESIGQLTREENEEISASLSNLVDK